MTAYSPYLGMLALLISNPPQERSVFGRSLLQLISEMEERSIKVLTSENLCDATSLLRSDTAIQCVLYGWEMDTSEDNTASITLLKALRERNTRVPVFLISNRSTASKVPKSMMQDADDFIWLPEDTSRFLSGRIFASIERYRQAVLPPMFGALVKFARNYEYSWHTPGHAGGTAFLKSTAGRAFYEYFGENLLRSDLSISVGELGSLLDHSGPIGQGERYSAKVFGAHRTYYVTNGSSTSNRVILMASVTRDQIALCDRNCHKSAEHAMTLSGAIPTYLMPSRNRYGIIGPIPPQNLTKAAVQTAIDNNPLVTEDIVPKTPVHAIVTNSTYDGLTYNCCTVQDLLGQSVDRMHFDEAWYGYARFNDLYKDRYAMWGSPEDHDETKPTVFATQSTHKLLAALSQASMIHVRDGRNSISHKRFNESFMMHASTSPNYAIIASCDVSAAMMEAPNGVNLTNESIEEAIAFRQVISELQFNIMDKNPDDWFFSCWQPPSVDGVPFHQVQAEKLKTEPNCWVLHPNEVWHGFDEIQEDGYCMLDPIKVSVLCPGMGDDSKLLDVGIPASVLSAYLGRQGIVVEKTTDFTVLFLFSIGITKGKWGTLVNVLLDFKSDYDNNVDLEICLPDLLATTQQRYVGKGLKDLAQDIFDAMKLNDTTSIMAAAFSKLPTAVKSPVQAYEKLVKNEVELVTLEQAAGRVVATGIVPYPPGIPLLMPGENAGTADEPYLKYLTALQTFDTSFPGFTHETHGIESDAGVYKLLVLTPDEVKPVQEKV